ncbi:hypothetical protein [Chroococcidiopsis sp.]|uniref:hypothetical protein n=1 Tax=Chroococcidiopsis sp. TaxID=3088168 RepID=UPI003F2F996F
MKTETLQAVMPLYLTTIGGILVIACLFAPASEEFKDKVVTAAVGLFGGACGVAVQGMGSKKEVHNENVEEQTINP